MVQCADQCVALSCLSPGVLQALRAAYDRYFDTSFEVVLHEAEAADHSSSNSSNAGSWTSGKPAAATADGDGGGLAPGGTCTVLLRRPAVFTLAVVWESPKVWISVLAIMCLLLAERLETDDHHTHEGVMGFVRSSIVRLSNAGVLAVRTDRVCSQTAA